MVVLPGSSRFSLESRLRGPLGLLLGMNGLGVSRGSQVGRSPDRVLNPSLSPHPVWRKWGRASPAGNSQKNSSECKKKKTKPQGKPWKSAWSGCAGGWRGGTRWARDWFWLCLGGREPKGVTMEDSWDWGWDLVGPRRPFTHSLTQHLRKSSWLPHFPQWAPGALSHQSPRASRRTCLVQACTLSPLPLPFSPAWVQTSSCHPPALHLNIPREAWVSGATSAKPRPSSVILALPAGTWILSYCGGGGAIWKPPRPVSLCR